MNKKEFSLTKLLKFALRITEESSVITLKYFGKKFQHRLKENLTPVTEADLKCEDFLLKKIKSVYPCHDLLSEENGEVKKSSEFKWIIDPIDGTKNFMRNIPFWGTLLALEFRNEIILGIISMPALKRVIYAFRGKGCYENRKKIRVSSTSDLKKSYMLNGGLKKILQSSYSKNFLNLVRSVNYVRGFGDCHGYTMVMKGECDFMIDPHVAPYDIASPKICLEEAGGKLTDVNGVNSIYNGSSLASNGILHEQVINFLKFY